MSPEALRWLTLNVCGLPVGVASPKLAPFADRVAELGRQLEVSDVDVANFQEVWTRLALSALRAALPSFPHVAWRRALTGHPAGGLVTFSRHPVGRVSYRSFAGTRPRAGDLRFRAKRALTGLIRGVLTLELSGLDTVVANTHLSANHDGDWSLDNRYLEFQRAQLHRLHSVLRGLAPAPGDVLTVVTGDFNVASDGPLYPAIIDGGAWQDPFADGELATFHLEFLPPWSARHRIDFLLVRGDRFPVLDHAVWFDRPVVWDGAAPRYLTDHCGLTARIGRPR